VTKKELVVKIFSRFFPEFSNKITWSVLLVGFGLLSSPLVVEIVRKLVSVKFELDITGGNDPILGFLLVVVALLHNLVSKLIDFKREKVSVIDLKHNIMSVRSLIDSVEDFDKVKESSWWGFIETNLTDWEKQYLTPPAISHSFGISPNQLTGNARKKQIVSEMLARLEKET